MPELVRSPELARSRPGEPSRPVPPLSRLTPRVQRVSCQSHTSAPYTAMLPLPARVFLVLLAVAAVRAGHHFVRLAVLAAMGLAGMYMLHMLAQDYNKISNRPAAAATRALIKAVFKRDTLRQVEQPEWALSNTVDSDALDRVLEHDPRGCARKLVCQLAARSPTRLRDQEAAILRFVNHEQSSKDQGVREFRQAYNLGITSRDPAVCSTYFRKCPFEARTILKLLDAYT